MTELTLELYLATFFPIILFIAGLIVYYLRDIDKSLGDMKVTLALLAKDRAIDNYLDKIKSLSNPSFYQIPPERDRLLQKLRAGTITREESLRLQAILRREAELARQKNLVEPLLAILALLFIIAVILSLLGER